MSFIHGPGIDEPLSVTYYDEGYYRYDEETEYYIADSQGSIVRLTDEYGYVTDSYAYDSFGNFIDPDYGYDSHYEEEMYQPYAYTGREYDDETGLYYYRARYYDMTIESMME